ncbi:hypothetical protein [Sandarakinorhabdus glacialis]|nr:hypothetical protein [Polymorphobacter glacialis]
MDSQTTFALLAAGLALAIAASLGDRARRRAPLAWHAHLPWNAAIFTGAAIALVAAVHIVTLIRQGSI